MPKYSVIVPVYHVEAYLAACIDSVLLQKTDVDYELILVDDGSADKSGEICDAYAEKHPQIRVFHIENQGVSHARNLGVANAAGEYVLFLDADDIWDEDLFAAVQEMTAERTDMALFGYGRLCEDGSKIPFSLPVVPGGERGEAYLHRLFDKEKVPCFYSCCYVYRREFLNKNQLWFREDLKVSEDFEQIMRALSLAERITGCDRPLYHYRIRGNSATATLSAKKLMDNLSTKAAFFRKYPTAAMANLYANNALLVSRLKTAEADEVLAFLKTNRDILEMVSENPLKLGRLLVNLLGDNMGSRVYQGLRSVSRCLRKSA